jgi:hypothetical protein
MTQTIYGLIQSGNRYYYAIGEQAYIIQIQPFPAAWRKTPSTSWKRVHGNFLHLDNLGLSQGPSGLELDPLAEFDRSAVKVYRLHSSNGKFEYEPDWDDAIPYGDWTDKSDWKEILSNLLSEIDPKVLNKLREFSHFHWRLIEALHEWQGFKYLIDPNPALAVCLAGRLRVGSKDGEKRPRLDYKDLYYRTEAEIAGAIGFGDSDEVVHILRKVVPDACKPLDLVGLYDLMENPITRKALLDAEIITYPALLLLRSPLLGPHLTGSFLSDFASAFPHSLDILTCPWGPLLRGGGKGDEFTWSYQQALDVVEFAEDPTIYSIEDLKEKHSTIFMQAYAQYHK